MIRSIATFSMQFGFNCVGVSCSTMSDVSSNGGKYGRRQSTLNTRCRPRNGGNAELEFIVSHSLGNGVRTISEWFEFPIGSDKAFFLQMQSDFIAHLKLLWHLMLIMLLLVLGI